MLAVVAAITLLSFAPLPNSFQSLTFWSYNSLNYPTGTLLLVWSYRELRNSQETKPAKLILMGAAFGVFPIARMYFFAWIINGVLTSTVFSISLNR